MFRVLAESIISDQSATVVKANPQIIFESSQKYLTGFKSRDGEKNFIIRANSDKFDYRLMELENGIKILLVSDPSFKNNNDLGQDENLTNSTSNECDSDCSEDSSCTSSNSESSNCSGKVCVLCVSLLSYNN